MGITDKDGFVYSCGNNSSGELGLGDNKSRIVFTRIGDMDIMVDSLYIPVGVTKDVIIHQGATFNLKSDIVGGDKLEIQNTNTIWLTTSKIEGVDNSGIKDLSKCLPNYRFTGEKIGRVCVIAKSEEGHTRSIWVNVVDGENSKASSKVVNGDGYTVTLRSDGSVWAFGSITGKNSPSKIEMQEEVIDISSGSSHVLLLGKSGKVYSFGANSKGQLGTGNVDARNNPKAITLGINTEITKVVACR